MSTTSREKKYKRRKINEKRGLGFLPSSDSDSDQEELPHSQRHQKQKQVKGLAPEIKKAISTSTARGDAVAKEMEQRNLAFVDKKIDKRIEKEIKTASSGSEGSSVFHDIGEKRFELRFPGVLQSAILEYEIEGEEQTSGDYLSSRSSRLNFWHAVIPDRLKSLGMGDRLANAALDYAMERQMKVRLTHPFLRKWIELNGTASQKAIVVSGAPKSAPGGKEEPSKPEKPKPMFPVYNRSHGNFMNEYELPK